MQSLAGSGTARAVISAGLLFGDILSRAHGIEILPVLHSFAEGAVSSYEECKSSTPELVHHNCFVSIEKNDFLSFDCFPWWKEADIVFINSTCFTRELMEALARRAGGMKRGARVVTLTHRLHGEGVELVEAENYTMSWGLATAFFHRIV